MGIVVTVAMDVGMSVGVSVAMNVDYVNIEVALSVTLRFDY